MSEKGLRLEKAAGGIYHADIRGPITDVHMHPRLFDPRFYNQPDSPNGKAGIHMYSKAAVLAGFNQGLVMPNESLRIPHPEEPDQTELVPYPLTTPDRILSAASVIIQRSLLRTGIIMGVDPEIIGYGKDGSSRFTTKGIEASFSNRHVQELTAALKIYGDETTGGYAIPLEKIMPVSEVWYKHNPGKPVILHLEDESVGTVLENWPKDWPVHIAHVSSRQELEPVITAIDDGKDVTCEATPHHLFLTDATLHELGPYGCMKPTLKSKADQGFLWDNLEYIHIFASDCAPHRQIDKVGIDGKGIEKPANGVANHDVFLPLFFPGIMEGWLTEQDLYDRIVTNPIKRFGLPFKDIRSRFELRTVTAAEAAVKTEYGINPFIDSPETPEMAGKVISAYDGNRFLVTPLGGEPLVSSPPGYDNLIRF